MNVMRDGTALDSKLQIPMWIVIERRIHMVARMIADPPYFNELIVTESPHNVLTLRRASR